MSHRTLIEGLRRQMDESLRAELAAHGCLCLADAERLIEDWQLIAEWSYEVEWWAFLEGDSPEEARHGYAAKWLRMQAPEPEPEKRGPRGARRSRRPTTQLQLLAFAAG